MIIQCPSVDHSTFRQHQKQLKQANHLKETTYMWNDTLLSCALTGGNSSNENRPVETTWACRYLFSFAASICIAGKGSSWVMDMLARIQVLYLEW